VEAVLMPEREKPHETMAYHRTQQFTIQRKVGDAWYEGIMKVQETR